MKTCGLYRVGLLASVVLFSSPVWADQGARLLATGGASTIEGSGGGGIVPWATLSSYGGDDQVGVTLNMSEVSVDDFRLSVQGAAVTWNNRVELSYAEQTFDLSTMGGELNQRVLGAKVRVLGDLIYGDLPQISVGLQQKKTRDFALPSAVGAQSDSGTDWYLSAAKGWLDGLFHRTWVANLTVRSSKANQLGLLGFGGDESDSRDWLGEASVAVFLNRYWATGIEYRQKPDNLSFAEEQSWKDWFVAYFPNKHVSVVGAYTDLGSIAGLDDQTGWYLSVQAAF